VDPAAAKNIHAHRLAIGGLRLDLDLVDLSGLGGGAVGLAAIPAEIVAALAGVAGGLVDEIVVRIVDLDRDVRRAMADAVGPADAAVLADAVLAVEFDVLADVVDVGTVLLRDRRHRPGAAKGKHLVDFHPLTVDQQIVDAVDPFDALDEAAGHDRGLHVVAGRILGHDFERVIAAQRLHAAGPRAAPAEDMFALLGLHVGDVDDLAVLVDDAQLPAGGFGRQLVVPDRRRIGGQRRL